ncbi:DUF222 domain-containing protein [Nocardioides sp. J2M5]|uniref:HNH endonuclease signature motif containing protein n=1 Tax=Nocardioides palaemonis TaxID=2829810 RepID=UPI001BAE2A9B|nr:HNH endonuclease signature motif containing protein [Nocardioides palaemonis]MBS2937715.1 DUF222 domain-containing protein [Nocardioides palaemonis]
MACAGDLRALLKGVVSVEPVFMSVADKRAALVELVAARSQLDGLLARVLAASDDLGTVEGSRDATAWLASETRSTRRESRRDLALGRALEAHPEVGRQLADGTLRAEQARAIVDAVDALPSRVDDVVRAEAEARLLAYAREHDAKGLRQIGKRILDVVAPEVGESAEADALEAEERRAEESVSFSMSDDGEGRCHGRFTVPSPVGAVLRRILLALANPARHTDADLRDEAGVWKPSRRRMGEAFVEYVERYPTDAAPQTAGVNATVVVTLTLRDLLGDRGVALLDDGTRMSAAQARRLACEAGVIPVVLGGDGQVLDLGRTRRLFSKAQRIALGLRDGGCTARGCETTASGCHAHHDDPWSNGGTTDLANGRLLCPRHHRLAHDPRYAKTIHADNQVTFVMRT